MNKPLIKICGITRLEDAVNAAAAGADLVGFIFYKGSPRYIEPGGAGLISTELLKLYPSLHRVGVFVDAPFQDILTTVKMARLTMVQLHGTETPADVTDLKERLKKAGFGEVKIIKAMRIRGRDDIEDSQNYDVDYLLFDAFVEGEPGGTGKVFNWNLLDSFSGTNKLFLSGGISIKNIETALNKINPCGIDVSSSLEAAKGIKDKKKIDDFMKIIKMSH